MSNETQRLVLVLGRFCLLGRSVRVGGDDMILVYVDGVFDIQPLADAIREECGDQAWGSVEWLSADTNDLLGDARHSVFDLKLSNGGFVGDLVRGCVCTFFEAVTFTLCPDRIRGEARRPHIHVTNDAALADKAEQAGVWVVRASRTTL